MLHEDGLWNVLGREKHQGGRMAKSWNLPHGMAIARAAVQGVFVRWADGEENKKCAFWHRSKTW